MSIHAIVGSGPLGQELARQLHGEGRVVRLVSRHPAVLPGVETRSVDALKVSDLAAALDGADLVYNCANAPYHLWHRELPPLWRGVQEAVKRVGASLVLATNLYAYGEAKGAFTNKTAFAPRSGKGRVRAALEQELLDAVARGELNAAIVRASDFYGPGVLASQVGDRFFPPILAGKTAGMIGRVDVPHSYAFLPDFARTMICAASDPEAFGKTWIVPHAPAVTATELGSRVAELLSERGIAGPSTAVKPVTKGMLRLAGLFNPGAREVIEMFYQFDRPFVVDSSDTESRFGIGATPLDEGLRKTLEWYAARRTETKESAGLRKGV